MATKKMTAQEFAKVAPTLRAQIIAGINNERQDCALPSVGGASSDLYSDLPPVDSKTVAKMSPIVKDIIGRRLDPKWIRKGGYESPEAAADDMLARIREHHVAPVPSPAMGAGGIAHVAAS